MIADREYVKAAMRRLSGLRGAPSLDSQEGVAAWKEVIDTLARLARDNQQVQDYVDDALRSIWFPTPADILSWARAANEAEWSQRQTAACDHCGGLGFVGVTRNGYSFSKPCPTCNHGKPPIVDGKMRAAEPELAREAAAKVRRF